MAPDRACDIIVASAVLHNEAKLRKERVTVIMDHPEDDLEPVHLDERTSVQGQNCSCFLLMSARFVYVLYRRVYRSIKI